MYTCTHTVAVVVSLESDTASECGSVLTEHSRQYEREDVAVEAFVEQCMEHVGRLIHPDDKGVQQPRCRWSIDTELFRQLLHLPNKLAQLESDRYERTLDSPGPTVENDSWLELDGEPAGSAGLEELILHNNGEWMELVVVGAYWLYQEECVRVSLRVTMYGE